MVRVDGLELECKGSKPHGNASHHGIIPLIFFPDPEMKIRGDKSLKSYTDGKCHLETDMELAINSTERNEWGKMDD